MSGISLYDITVPVLTRGLKNTDAWLQKAEAWCKDHGKPESEILAARLAPDMNDLVFQVLATATFSANSTLSSSWEYKAAMFPEGQGRSFAELHETLQKAIQALEATKKEDVDGREAQKYSFWPGGKKDVGSEFTFDDGVKYLNQFSLPNFWFHSTTAYAIMRSKGVQLGKIDFLAGGGGFA